MERSTTYNTKQKDIILKLIKKQNKEFTIQDIYERLKKEIGLTTIYRLVDKLVSEGYLNKFIKENNTAYYQYLEKCEHHNHFYLKCGKCGTLIHIDCDCINELSNHIFDQHKFVANKNIIINGICEKCMRG